MKCQSDIQKIALSKLDDAEFLFANDRYDAAFYLGGYAIELLLKARICKTLGIDNFFDESWLMKKLKFPQAFKIHDLRQLIILAGVCTQLEADINSNASIRDSWFVVCQWNENSRYFFGKTKLETDKLLISIKKIVAWIQEHL